MNSKPFLKGLQDQVKDFVLDLRNLTEFDPNQVSQLSHLQPYGILKPDHHKGISHSINKFFPFEDHEWNYEINEYNFRDNFPLDAKIKIAVFGCSATMGTGVDKTYSAILQDMLPPLYGVFNFATAGNHIISMYKKFVAVTNCMDIDTAVMTFPHMKLMAMRDNQFKVLSSLTRVEPHTEEWMQLMTNLDQKEYDSLHKEITQGQKEVKLKLMLLKYIDGMLRIAKQKNIDLIFGGWDSDLYFSISKEYPTLTLPKWEWADFAHKADHPGIQAHKDYATYIHNKMFE
jgi:hypothetical protein